jgi:hypothetical protein
VPARGDNALMANVTTEQLRRRHDQMAERRRYYEWKSQQPGRLMRHEVWRHEYLARPYLIGASDEQVAERFRHIFMNVSEVGKSGKLQMIPPSETDQFMQVFTHMLEEFEARGLGFPPGLIESARGPLHRYFAHGTPRGVTMFENYRPPDTPILVKYGKREFLKPMMANGSLRLANAKSYNNVSHCAAVRDDETSRTFFIPTYQERLAGTTHIELQGQRIEIGDDDLAIPLIFDDYYLFSLCEHIHYRMPTDFDADAALVIRDPVTFTQRLTATFLARFPAWHAMEGRVTYYDPYRDYSRFKVPEMAKHFGYTYQKEVRIAFRPRRPCASNLEPLFLSVGPMGDYADLVSL